MDIEGLILESHYPELQYCIKGPMETTWQDGFPRQQPKHIVLYFDGFACELDEMARTQEWTDEDKVYVGNALEAALKRPSFTDLWIHQAPKPPVPWPNYNETHHNQVVTVAQATGLLNEALSYEQHGRPGGPRPSVVEKLTAALGEGEAKPSFIEELTAV